MKRYIQRYPVFLVLFLLGLFTQPLSAQSPCGGGNENGGFGCPLLEFFGVKPPGTPINIPRVHAVDPNEISGPTGYEAPRWVAKKDRLGYTIFFENDPDFATAPAQVVKVNLPVDPHLNINSVRLGNFGFGFFAFEVPPNSTFYSKRLDVRDSLNVYVDVTAGIDIVKKEVFWIFESIDPLTGLPPEDGNTGFLPVNDTTVNIYNDTLPKRGEGYVTFTIVPASIAVTGDTITAKASIVFDINAAIETNTWINLIDAFPPTSTLDSLPDMVPGNSITIKWSGDDDVGGVGIDYYDLYASKDGGPFLLSQEKIDTNLFVFTGAIGSTYDFYTLATDFVGNRESPKFGGEQTVTFGNLTDSIQVNSPLAGQIVCANDTLVIAWQAFGNVAAVDIALSINGGNTFVPLANGVVANTSPFRFPIPGDALASANCLIKISDAGTSGKVDSSAIFRIKAIDSTYVSAVTCLPAEVGVTSLVLTDVTGCDSVIIITTTLENTPPNITCPANISIGNCEALVVTYVPPVGTDNCPGATTLQTDNTGLNSGSIFPQGITTLMYTVTDVANITASCSFTVTVTMADNQPPAITCPNNISVNNSPNACDATVTFMAPVGTDNCPNPVTVQTGGLASGAAFPVGITTNVFTVTDGTNQTATCSFTVTVTDNQAPAITCPANISVNNTPNSCDAAVTFTAPIGTDNCPNPVTVQTSGLASGAAFPVGITTNVFTVTDGANQTATCLFTVTVTDNQAPVITCPANISVNNTQNACDATVTFMAPVGTDNCPNPVTVQTGGLASGAAFPVGITTNVFTVTDGTNQTATCSFTVTVTDNQAPAITCPANISVNNTPNSCDAAVTFTAPIGTDNCPNPVTVQTGGLASGSAFPVGITTNVFTVTDGANQTATCSFTVTVTDNQPPAITCPTNISVNNTPNSCDATVMFIAPMGTDNCPNPVTVQTGGLASGATFPVGITTNVFTVTDGANQTATCSFTVTVTDNQAPAITCPANISVNNTPNSCDATVTFIAPVGTDNCPNPVTVQTGGLASGAAFPVGITTNVFTVTDGANQTATCSFTVTVTDNQAPVITCPTNISVNNTPNSCDATVTFMAPVGTDNCPNPVTVQTGGLASGAAFPVGITTNVFTVTDGANQTATCSFTVTVTDNQAPVVTCPTNISVNNSPNACDATVAFTAPVGTDNCPNPVTVQTGGLASGAAFPVGITTNVFTVTDGANQTATCSFTVTVTDNQAPVITCPTNILVNNTPNSCDATVTFTAPVGTDNCPNPVTVQTGGLASGAAFPVGITTNVFTVTDAVNQTATCSFAVTVTDNQLPVIACPANIVVCEPAVVTYTAPLGTDNCPGATTAQTMGLTSGGNFPVGATTTNTFTVTAFNGQTSNCSFSVTINALPQVFTVIGGGQYCTTDTQGVPVGLSGSQTGVNYQLLFNGNNIGTPVTGNGTAIEFGDQAGLGAYTIVAVNATTGCTLPMGGSVTISSIECNSSISDPCTCLNNATTLTNGQFGETITVNAPAGQTWTVSAVTGLFTSTSAAPPSAPTPITVGTVLTANGTVYTLDGRHIDAIGYTISVTNGRGTTLSIGNNCQYPNPAITSNLDGPFCLFSDPVTLTGNPGDANTVSQGFTVNGVPATTFNPGAGIGQYTIVYTVNGGTPKATGANDPGCIQSVSTIVAVVATPTVVNCNNLVQISLDADCSVEVTPDMVLEGSYACFDNFEVSIDRTLPLGNGPWVTPVILGVNDIGKTWAVKVTNLVNGNSCWGQIKVEDKLAPVVTCNTIAISCAETNTDPSYLANVLGITNAFPTVIENCSVFTSSYNDVWTDLDCPTSPTASSITGFITRTWFVTDASGNTASCTQTINIVGARVADVNFPVDVVINCASNVNTNPSATGTPFITFTYPSGPRNYPIWPSSNYCELQTAFVDQEIPVCDGTYKILRTWTAYDWCTPTSPFPPTTNPAYYVQLVKVVDDAGPVFACPDALTVSTNTNNCCSVVDLPNVVITDNCSRINSITAQITGIDPYNGSVIGTFEVGGVLQNFPGNNLWTSDTLGNWGFTPCLPIGTHIVRYTAKDDCGNESSCTFNLTVADQDPPTVVSEEFTQVSLGIDGFVFVNASSFDNGSFDNCGPVYFKARRMDANPIQTNTLFHDQVKFGCSDIGDTITVVFRVYDVDPGAGSKELDFLEGDYNDVMVQVFVEDKIKPSCSAPANVTVSCEAFDPSLWAYGQPQTADNCSNPTVTGTLVLTQFDSLCNKGTITRRWTVVDAAGNSAVCSQRIVITYEQNYWVKFPADRIVTVCDGTNTFGAPEFYGEDCELLATSYVDEFFTVIPDACYKIERTWTVINWCKYDVNLPANSPLNVYVPNPNPNATTNHPTNLPGVTVSAPGTTVVGWVPTSVKINPTDPLATNYATFWRKEANSYTYKQIVKVLDGQDPVVACPTSPTDYCDYSVNDGDFYNATQYWDPTISSHDLCEGDANIEITATDGCSGAAISFRYLLFLDMDANGSMETVINSVNPPGFNNINYNNINNANYAGGTPWQFDFRPVAGDRKWGWGMQQDAPSGNNRTARVRWFNQANNPAAGAVPQLPYGTHKIKWFIEDGCGNETVCENTIVVKDCKKPTVVCVNGLAVNLMSSGMVQLWASDFLQYTEDNCTPVAQIKIGIRRKGVADGQGNVTGFPKNADGSPQTGVQFTCADLGTQLVELWGLDKAGNADYCETYVLIQDNANVCNSTAATIAGALKTDEVEGIEDANVELVGSSNGVPMFSEVFSEQTGDYMFSNALPYASNATITPTLELDLLNGVNTWDLILISRHILGLEPLNTPYKLISADANKSGTVTTFDIVELRKLILGTYPKLPSNSSWRFVDKEQVFTNPANPFADVIRENIQIASIQQSINNGDFVGAKIGDVDNTATPNNLVASDDRTAGTLLFDVEERSVKAGETFAVTFTADQAIKGYQYTMNLNGLDVEAIEGSTMSDENFAVFASTSLGEQSAVTTSWDAPTVFNGKASYTMTFKATKSGKLSQMLSVSSRITRAIAFTGTEKMGVGLRFNNGGSTVVSGQAFEVYQNTPNPWVSKTQIGFYLPSATEAKLTVYDATGRTVYTANGDFGKGYNAFTIDRKVITTVGSLYYKVETTTDSGVKQMIQMK